MIARLPNFRHFKRTIQRQRIVNDLPQIPHGKTFTSVPASLRTNNRGETFLQYDSGPGEHRVLIFSSDEQLDILSGCEEVLIDGTFKVKFLISLEVDDLLSSLFQMTPTIFNQLYTVYGVHRDAFSPLAFILLSDIQKVNKEKMINQLSILHPTWNPNSVMIDFE
jgi:hypothetical protein